MALSEEELRLEVLARVRHQSPKDRAPCPGIDGREFWKRAEDRDRGTSNPDALASSLAGEVARARPGYRALEDEAMYAALTTCSWPDAASRKRRGR